MEKKWFLDVVFSIRLPASVFNGGPKQEKNNNSQFLLESEILFMAQILEEFHSSFLFAFSPRIQLTCLTNLQVVLFLGFVLLQV